MTFNISELLFNSRTQDLMSGAAVAEADANTQDGMKAEDEDKLVIVRQDVKLALVVQAPKGLRTHRAAEPLQHPQRNVLLIVFVEPTT